MAKQFQSSNLSGHDPYGYDRSTGRYYSSRLMQTTYRQGRDVGDLGCMGCGPVGAMGALGAEGAGSGAGDWIAAAGQAAGQITGAAISAAQSRDGSKKCAKLRRKAAKVKKADKRARLMAAAESFCQAVNAGLPASVIDAQAASLENAIDAEPATDNTMLYAALGIGTLAALGGGAWALSRRRK